MKEQGDVPRHWLKKFPRLVDQNPNAVFAVVFPCVVNEMRRGGLPGILRGSLIEA